MVGCALLMSVRPKYAEKILQGMKTVELRRMRPSVSRGDLLLLYVSSPVKEVKGMSVIDRVTSSRPDKLWKQIRHKASITKDEFDSYFEGAEVAVAIHFSYVKRFALPVALPSLREFWPGFRPPQSYRYLTSKMVFEFLERVRDIKIDKIWKHLLTGKIATWSEMAVDVPIANSNTWTR